VVSQRQARTLQEWLAAKKMTPDQLMRANAGLSTDVLTRWVKTGQRPQEVDANGRCLQVSLALDVPPEEFDCGPYRRGVSEGEYRLFLKARGRDDTGWRASIDAWWTPPQQPRVAPREVAVRFNDAEFSAEGPTEKAALDVMEARVRELIQSHPVLVSDERGDETSQT
jgi:hypothetical protein